MSIRSFFLTCLLSIGVFSLGSPWAQTTSRQAGRLTVGSQAEFERTLAGVREAKVIALKPGVYDELVIKGVTAGAAVSVVAAEPADRPVIRKLSLSGSLNVTMEGLRFVGTGREAPEAFLAEISQSQNIRILKSEFAAPQSQTRVNAGALRAVDVTTLQIADTVVENLGRGIVVDRSKAVVIEHSRFRGLDVAGIGVSQSDGVTIDSNRFEDFRQETVGARQFIGVSTRQTTTASRNIRIDRNVMIQTAGEPISGIFLANEEKLPYENVEVSRNIVVTRASHGITVDRAVKASITDNMVLDAPKSAYKSAIRLQNARDGEVSRNITVAYGYTGSQGTKSLRNVTVPPHNNLTSRRILERVLEGLKPGSGAFPVHAGHSVLPEQRAAGPRS